MDTSSQTIKMMSLINLKLRILKLRNLSLLCVLCALTLVGCSGGDVANNQPAKSSSKSNAVSPSNKTDTTTKTKTKKKLDVVQTSSAKKNNSASTEKVDVKPLKPKQSKPPQPKKKIKPSEPDKNEPEFHDALIAATNEYLQYGMVNAVALAAPLNCAPATVGPREPAPLMSASEDSSSHGEKLYFLFAKDISNYMGQSSPAPVGQTIVKESWSSIEANPNARNLRNHVSGNRINPRTTVGDKVMEIGARKNFFIMTKLDKDTPKTDDGWVYGIVDSDTRKVIASGKVASCIYCHKDATNDRQFGPAEKFQHTAIISVEDLIGDTPAPDTTMPNIPIPEIGNGENNKDDASNANEEAKSANSETGSKEKQPEAERDNDSK